MKYILLLAIALSVVGCNKKQKSTIPNMQNNMENMILKFNIQGDPHSFHPHTGIDLNCRSMQKAVFEGLTRTNSQGIPELAVAEKVEISPCQTKYTFTLKKTYWSNGDLVLASHFESAWKKAMAPQSDCLRPDLFYAIKNAMHAKKGEVPLDQVGVYAPDTKTLVVTLERPIPYLLELVSIPAFSPLYDAQKEPTVFNGPFKLAQWEHEKALTLVRNPLYWDCNNVKLNEIQISLVRDPNTALFMYEKGELDWMGSPFTHLPLDSIPLLEQSSQIHSQPIAGVYWFFCNTTSFPLNNRNIRKALAYSLNRTELAEHVLYGEIPCKGVTPMMTLEKDQTPLYPDHAIDKAMMYFEQGLKELNLTKETFPPIALSHSDISGQKKLAEAAAMQWEKALGIKIELTGAEWNVFFSNLFQKQYQMAGCIMFSAFYDAMYHLEFFKDLHHRYNASQWQSPEYSALLIQAERAADPKKRQSYLDQAESLLLDEMPIIPIYLSTHKYLMRDHVQGILISNLGFVDLKGAYINTGSQKYESPVVQAQK